MTTDQEKWLEQNTVNCERHSARIAHDACQEYSKENPEKCKGCEFSSADPSDTVSSGPWKRRRVKMECSVSDCSAPSHCKGLCRKHYQRQRYHDQKASGKTGQHRKDEPNHLEKAQASQKPIKQLPAASKNSVTIFFPEVDAYILEALRTEAAKAGTDVAEDMKAILHMFVTDQLVIKESV